MNKQGMKRLIQLRKQHARISYLSHDYELVDGACHIVWHFELDPGIAFDHRLSLYNAAIRREGLQGEQLELLIFNLGMVELISYFKLACPERIEIHPYRLNSDQVQFWYKLYLNGLGEYMFVNGIDVDVIRACRFSCSPSAVQMQPVDFISDPHRALIPVGGGKDSAVTLNLTQLVPGLHRYILMVNPIAAAERCARISGVSETDFVRVARRLDARLLEMNKQGYLNGHVPFSASIAFIGLLSAALLGIRSIVLSNEASANQGNILYHQMDVNHQYSKSFEFEADFRDYVANHISGTAFDYFSLLRSMGEMKITRLFADMPEYHAAFVSCNRAGRDDAWCGTCPKCLFVAVMLSVYLSAEQVERIIGCDIMADTELSELLALLAGFGEHKPLECVGTYEEIRSALLSIRDRDGVDMPALVASFFAEYGQSMQWLDTAELSRSLDRAADDFVPPLFQTAIE
ncbi:hypothetical protein [Mariprofundus ferrooxydans]|uniref:UDP-N-acetyl-alpha-D-muramoyl-L-alanyl-L-glutamate epimerase n=1 Tax=Mariprofundus ferrooxydans PV-1 TaxID=314345 RepID=Q0EY59_9PROT|nr:hypothetical protein [Mariprofundus ferrooxydans]EAU54167.1 hypothetical protein SPV1_05382 [Mariprofundus ferrooxydans PV-1]